MSDRVIICLWLAVFGPSVFLWLWRMWRERKRRAKVWEAFKR